MSPQITILGAGAMGSAFATPATRAGLAVSLWGTHLDTEIVALLRDGRPHPRTGEALPAGVRVFDHADLGQALADSSLVACAIASDGVRDVMASAATALAAAAAATGATPGHPRAVLIMSKGFAVSPSGRVELLTDTVARTLADHGVESPVVAVGGPCKANEVAAGTPTAAVFAATDPALAGQLAAEIASDDYGIEAGGDPAGVEVAAALKNVFAIALGICDGLAARLGRPRHDLRAAVFAEAVAEIATVVEMCGGRAGTAHGLAGVGDLEVTGLSGRNRAYGELIGSGLAPTAAFDRMAADGLTVEGHAAAPLAVRLIGERGTAGAKSRVPLLDLLAHGLELDTFGGDVEWALARATLPRHRA